MKRSTLRNILDFTIIGLLAIALAFIALSNSHGATQGPPPKARMIILKQSKDIGEVKVVRKAGAKMLIVKKGSDVPVAKKK